MSTSRALGVATAIILAGSLGCSAPDTAEANEQSATTQQAAPTLQYINPGRNFSEAVNVDGILYLSGKLGTSREGEQGIGPETTRALESIRSTLEANGSGMDRVIKCTVFLANIDDFGGMNTAYAAAWPGDKPARSTVAVGGLVGGALIEIECMAAVR